MTDLIGRQLENYRIDTLLGEGGMGAVYQAYDLNLARPVALKVMHAHLARRQEFQQRFLQEARAAARLSEHPSVVKIHHFGESQGLLYMVMAMVQGGSLSGHINHLQKTGEVVQLREMLFLLAQVGDALGYAHKHNVVHRDIKPSNVLVLRLEEPEREGEPPLRAIVTDFGLAKLLEGGMETQSGNVMGTLAFMSPEQCLHNDLDGRSDIYSLGVMAYLLTTGRLPFKIETPSDAVMKHLNEVPPAPRLVNTNLPVPVDAIIQKAIAKKPEDRFQKAETMALALREAGKRISEAEVTQFVGEKAVFSLATHLQSKFTEREVEPSRMGFDLSAASEKDQLIIAQKGHTPFTVPLEKNQLVMGRSADCDIVLDNKDISRQHVRLQRVGTGWQIVDLNSTNGTYLDSAKLLSGVPEMFYPGKTLRVGPYFIHWQKAGEQRTQMEAYTRTLPANATHLESTTGRIGATLKPNLAEVAPGSSFNFQVMLFNQGMVVDQFNLSIEGLSSDWISIPLNNAQLMPGASAALTFNLHPPMESRAKAGIYEYQVVVQSEANPDEEVFLPGKIEVKPFERYSAEMHPTQIPDGGISKVRIRNEGNVEGIFSLTGQDPQGNIQFSGEKGRIRVAAGESIVQEISPKAKTRLFIGNRKLLSFQVRVQQGSGSPQVLAGQLEQRPLIPTWVLSLLSLLLFFCVIAGGIGINALSQNKLHVTQTAQQEIANAIEAQTLQAAEDQSATVQAQGIIDAAATQEAINAQSTQAAADQAATAQAQNMTNEAATQIAANGESTQAAEQQTATSQAQLLTSIAETQTAQMAEQQTATTQAQNIFATQTAQAAAEQMGTAQAQTATAQAQSIQATQTAQAATATALASLLAYYPLTDNATDTTGKQANITLENAPFQNGAVYCNGVYPLSGGSNPCNIATPNLNGFNFNSFSIQIQFNAEVLKYMPVVVGGSSFRWIGFELTESGGIVLLTNNSQRESCTGAYQPNEWHTALLTYNGSEGKLYLDSILRCTVAFSLENGGDRDVSVINYSNATIFQGYVRELKIFNEPINPIIFIFPLPTLVPIAPISP